MSHDNRIYVNTTQNNLVVIDGEQNQLTVTHPITQVIEIIQSPRPTVIVTEETPNNVSVTEEIGKVINVVSLGPQGVSAPFTNLGNNNWTTTSNLQITGSISMSGSVVLSNNYGGIYTTTTAGTQIQSFYIDQGNNLIHRATSGGDHYFYEGNNALVRFVNGGTINLGGTSATSNPIVRIPAAGGMIVTGSILTNGNVGIGTSSPLSNLHVYKGLSGASLLGLEDGITLTLENDTTNYINFRSPNTVYAGLAFTTPADNSAGYIALRQSTGDMIFSNEKSTGYHTFLTSNTERLRIANTETTVRNNLIVTGSVKVSGSTEFIGNHALSGTNVITGNTILSGSIMVSGSSNFNNSRFIVTGSTSVLGTFNVRGTSTFSDTTFTITASQLFTGSSFIDGDQYITGLQSISGSASITGSLNVIGNININSGSAFYHWGNKLFNYGAFSDTTSQSGSANTAYPITYNTNDVVGYGINVVSQSRITVDHTGLYNLQFSTQLDRVAGSGNALVSIWLRVTGSDVANSCTDVALTGNAASSAAVAAWNFVFPMSASQYCELIWSTNDANIHISAIGTRTNPVRPAVPSIIATVTQVA